jgi:capsular polysaccharide biosynthesis protein
MNAALTAYVRVLRTRWRWLVWGVLVALGATTVLLILQPTLYRVQQTVFVRTPGDVSRVIDGGDTYAQGRAKTYAAIASSPSLSQRVISDLGLDLDPEVLSKHIKAEARTGTVLIDIAVEAPSAAEATRTATALYSELSAMVRSLESVPGALVPRAELVQVNPPGPPVRVVAWGLPIPAVLAGAALIGLTLGAAGAVIRRIFHDDIDLLRVEQPGSAGQEKAPL